MHCSYIFCRVGEQEAYTFSSLCLTTHSFTNMTCCQVLCLLLQVDGLYSDVFPLLVLWILKSHLLYW